MQSLREVAPVEWDQRGDLSGDAVRRLSGRRQGLLPGRLRRAADAREERTVVSDR